MKKFASMSTQLSPIGLGTGLGLYKKKNNYTETLFKNYFKLCKKFNVKLIDTSPAYGNGASEILIGKYFSKYRKDFFIATKILPEMCSKKKLKISKSKKKHKTRACLKKIKKKYTVLTQLLFILNYLFDSKSSSFNFFYKNCITIHLIQINK